jgi:hypothetical protein
MSGKSLSRQRLCKKNISHGDTEITEDIKVFPCFSASVANIMLKYAQRRGKIIEQKLKAIALG